MPVLGGNTSAGALTGTEQVPLLDDTYTTIQDIVDLAAVPANDSITNAILANVATATIKGRITASTGDPEDLTAAQAGALIGGQNIPEPVTALTSSSGACNIDCALGDYFTFTLTENVTSITFSNLPASGKAQTIMVRILQHASAVKTVAFPSSFKWAGGVTGVVSATVSAYDVLAITTFDQGTRWEATLAKAFA